MPTETSAPAVFPPAIAGGSQAVSTVAALADILEEDIWLAKQKSKRTRRAYKQDVQHFMSTLTIRSYDELRKVDHRAVIAWQRILREGQKAAAPPVRRRLAALSSLFSHLVRYGYAEKNPVSEVERPAINRRKARRWRSPKRMRANCSTNPTRRPWGSSGPGHPGRGTAGGTSPR